MRNKAGFTLFAQQSPGSREWRPRQDGSAVYFLCDASAPFERLVIKRLAGPRPRINARSGRPFGRPELTAQSRGPPRRQLEPAVHLPPASSRGYPCCCRRSSVWSSWRCLEGAGASAMPGLPVAVYSRCERWGRTDRKVGREDLLKSGRSGGSFSMPDIPEGDVTSLCVGGRAHAPTSGLDSTRLHAASCMPSERARTV